MWRHLLMTSGPFEQIAITSFCGCPGRWEASRPSRCMLRTSVLMEWTLAWFVQFQNPRLPGGHRESSGPSPGSWGRMKTSLRPRGSKSKTTSSFNSACACDLKLDSSKIWQNKWMQAPSRVHDCQSPITLWSMIQNKSSSLLNFCYLFHKSKG